MSLTRRDFFWQGICLAAAAIRPSSGKATAVTRRPGDLIPPVEALSESPAGRLPEMTAQLYGVTPPYASSTAEYAAPTVPSGRLVVSIARSAPASYS